MRVSPDFTVCTWPLFATSAEGTTGTEDAKALVVVAGMCNVFPICSLVGSTPGFASFRAVTVTLNFLAMLLSLSPLATVYSVAAAGEVGPGCVGSGVTG